jgi:hypothetical protein
MNKSTDRALFFLFGTGYILLRAYRLWDNPLFDFDAVKNLSIAKDMCAGHFADVFHHASPLMHLLHALVYSCVQEHVIYLPLFLESLGLLLLVRVVLSLFTITSAWSYAAAYSLVGCSFLLVNAGRYFSIEPYTLFVFSLWLMSYIDYLKNKNTARKHLLWAGLLVFINYKMLVLLVFIVLIDVIQHRFTWKQLSAYAYAAWFVPFSMLIAWLTSNPWWKYGATLYAIIFNRAEVTQQQSHLFDFSGRFYVEYLRHYEHPIVFIGGIGIVYLLLRHSRFDSVQKILAALVVYWLLVMSLLPAAPRGVSCLVPLLVIAGVITIEKCLQGKERLQRIIVVILILSSFYSLQVLKKNTYDLSTQHYSTMANVIQAQKVKVLYTTLANGIVPYLDKTIEVRVVFDQRKLQKLAPGSLVLFDAEAILNGWLLIGNGQCLASFDNPCKTQIMLALENAEYAGYTFQEAMSANEAVRKLGKEQLCLFRVK